VATLFERVGGQRFFDELVDRFYAEVEQDPALRPMYPEDLIGPKEHLALFLGQYWGGPPTYSQERGHPRLRMRHAPFVIGLAERDAWLAHMSKAVLATRLDAETEAELLSYFETASRSLINSVGPTPSAGTGGRVGSPESPG
jgi:hemoglobin